MSRFPPVDNALLKSWNDWLDTARKRFGSSGFDSSARVIELSALEEAVVSRDLMFSAALEEGDRRGLIVALRAAWESGVLERPVAKVLFFAADSHSIAVSLARAAMQAAASKDVVLLSASPGNSPLFIHAALADAGFHVGTQSLTVRADLESIAPRLKAIPLRGTFRTAVAADSKAIVRIASQAFTESRFMSDPHFPPDWGSRLMEAWAGNLLSGGADEIIVAEAKDGEILGFAAMTLDAERQQRVPVLMAVEPRYSGAGIGAMLVRIMLEWYSSRGMKVFVGATEKSNVAINAMYAKLGFTVLDCNLVYHASPALVP